MRIRQSKYPVVYNFSLRSALIGRYVNCVNTSDVLRSHAALELSNLYLEAQPNQGLCGYCVKRRTEKCTQKGVSQIIWPIWRIEKVVDRQLSLLGDGRHYFAHEWLLSHLGIYERDERWEATRARPHIWLYSSTEHTDKQRAASMLRCSGSHNEAHVVLLHR